jgi:diguanylate cyclase (GGDEF)-like protein
MSVALQGRSLGVPTAEPVARRVAAVTAWALAGLALAALVVHAAGGLGGHASDSFFDKWVYDGIIVGSAVACLARAALVRVERVAWLALGLAVAAWAGGEIYYSVALADVGIQPFPSWSDAFFIAFYPLCFVGFVLLARARLSETWASTWLDGVIAALAVSAGAAAFVFQLVLDSVHGLDGVLKIGTSLAYPIGDLLLLGSVVAVLALTGWRPGRTWAVIAGGLALAAVADHVYVYQTAKSTYVEGGLLDTMWPASMLLIAYAAWQPARPGVVRLDSWRRLALPVLFSLTAVALLVVNEVSGINDVAAGLAIATIVAIIVRTAWSLSENLRLLHSTRADALTDALTGLGNRRQLLADLERELEWTTLEDPRVLVLFDLDGFKGYNDTFGHMAGDTLLARLGRNLKAAVQPYGHSYRLGGDEFCMLVTSVPPGVEAIIAGAAAALTDQGPGFKVTSSYGVVVLPREAHETSTALQLADQRMYSRKEARPSSARRQSADVLLGVLREREPELHAHVEDVAELSLAVGRRLGMSDAELEELQRAAELHDIGKVAIPEEILNKPAALDAGEWEFVRRHTILGERILASAPALSPVARLVRASHERFDGQGYPDQLAGREIPLGARIIAVCDAFDAMVSSRPYSEPVDVTAALDELRACSGSQFDPEVVDAFVEELMARPGTPGAVGGMA